MERVKEIPSEGARGNLIRVLKGTGLAIAVTLVLIFIL